MKELEEEEEEPICDSEGGGSRCEASARSCWDCRQAAGEERWDVRRAGGRGLVDETCVHVCVLDEGVVDVLKLLLEDAGTTFRFLTLSSTNE